MQKLFAGLCGLLLIPCAGGLVFAVYQELVAIQMTENSSHLLYSFVGGAAVWIILFFIFPRPLRSYILAHELSHLLAAWLSGVRGGRLRVGSEGGSVEVSKSTIWIALAPYLIPFYSLLLLALHWIASLWWDPVYWQKGLPFGLGFTWCFHLTFTLYILSVPQSDVQPYGRLGAYSFILSGNLLLLCLALFVINDQPVIDDLHALLHLQQKAYRFATDQGHQLISLIKNAIFQG